MFVVLKKLLRLCGNPLAPRLFASMGSVSVSRNSKSSARNFRSSVKGKEMRRLTFCDSEEATRRKTMYEIFRGWLVFKLFTYETLVDNSLKVNIMLEFYLNIALNLLLLSLHEIC